LAFGAAAVLVVIGAVFAWAWCSTGRSTIARALIWMEADIGDQHRFPARSIPARRQASSLLGGPEADLRAPAREADGDGAALDRLLRDTETRAFVVVHRDRVVYERYYGGSGRDELETSFSVAKSFLSTLVGIAIDQGLIADVDEPVTDYLPQLAARDPRFERITLRDLLTMSSGLRYEESSFPWPWGDDTYTYYGVDLRKEALERTEIERAPGREWHYNNYNPLLLGLVLERATGKSVSDYMASELWQPLGAARDTTWNLDSEGSGFEKMESGPQRDRARLRRPRLAPPARRQLERGADRLAGLGPRGDCRPDRVRLRQPLRILLVGRRHAPGAVLRLRELRAVHLRRPGRRRRRRPARERLGTRQRELAGDLPRCHRPTRAHSGTRQSPVHLEQLIRAESTSPAITVGA
jgi:CubicO group peptidase (beta-lactamase class C family)